MRVPVVMIVVILVYSLIVDLYIWNDIRKYSRSRLWSRLYAGFSVACWIFLVVSLLMPRRNSSSDTLTVMWMLYTYLTLYVPKLLYVLSSLIGRLFSLRRRRRNRGVVVGTVLALLVFAAMWWGVLGGRWRIDVNEVDVYSARLPQAFDGYRIAQISDLHVGTWGEDTRFIAQFVDSVNALRPDVVFFTGDIVNCSSDELVPFVKELSRLKAPDGVWSILGNHDYGDYLDWPTPKHKEANLQRLKDMQRDMGWRLLNNEHTFLSRGSDSIALIGVENWGEPPFHQYGRIKDAYSAPAGDINDSRYKILLTHNPEHWNQEISRISNIDLSLSGHTHAMQMMVGAGGWKWSPAAWRYEQWGGLYSRQASDGHPLQLYVNIGAGEVGMPFRIGADPEITLITLRKAR